MTDTRSQVTLRPRSKLERVVDALSDAYDVPVIPALDVLSQLTILHLVRHGAEARAALAAMAPLCASDGSIDAAKLARTPRELVASVCASEHVDEALRALLAAGEAGAGLDARCRADLADGRRTLSALPGMNQQRADLLMLHAGVQAVVAPTAHALRVASRVGYPGATYAAIARALDEELPAQETVDLAWRAHQLLELHGRALCVATSPPCQRCPLRSACAYHGSGEDPAARLVGRGDP